MDESALRAIDLIQEIDPAPPLGRVVQAIGLLLEGHLQTSSIGEVCEIAPLGNAARLPAEVVGFRENRVLLMPLGDLNGIGPGSAIIRRGRHATAPVGEGLLGRVIDGLGNPLDGLGPLQSAEHRPLYPFPPGPLERQRIKAPLDLGIRAINGLLTCGRGQRMGIFAGSGVGKSVLMGMIARYTAAEANVIALIGERSREVKEFIEKDLGPEGLRRSVVVAATSDQPPLVRRRGAFLAMAIAEYFRDRNRQVLLMMDSLTRLAHAQREIGLAIGEPPTTKGYTPSVFTLLPRFLERAGTGAGSGTITGLFTVLVEGDDLNDPIPDAVRAILDGHIVLSRDLAAQNQYPAIDLLHSASRVMIDLIDREHLDRARGFSDLMATYAKVEDLIHIGAYKPGSNPKADQAIARWDRIQGYLRQRVDEKVSLQESIQALRHIFE
ncbi:MAG: FliI/YscN family ATPase [Candidatus Manganitrophaceae bacterium]